MNYINSLWRKKMLTHRWRKWRHIIEFRGVSIIPLACVFFIIMILFIIYLPFITEIGMFISMPEAKTKKFLIKQGCRIFVRVDKQDRLYINNIAISRDKFDYMVEELLKRSCSRKVAIEINKDTSFGKAFWIENVLRGHTSKIYWYKENRR